MARTISRMPSPTKSKVKSAPKSDGYERHAVPYALTRTVGGACRGYVVVGPDFTYRVIPTSTGLIIESLKDAGTTNERVARTREYTVNPNTLEIT